MRVFIGAGFVLAVTLLVFFGQSDASMADMTHVLNNRSQHWPGFRGFAKTTVSFGLLRNGLWVEASDLEFAEHTGTHIDAPAHTWKGGIHLHEIPLEKLIGPAVVIDVIFKVKDNSDYLLAVEDVEDFEREHGRIPPKSIVFMQTDGDSFSSKHPGGALNTTMNIEPVFGVDLPITSYGDSKKYFGSETPDNTSTLHFPAFGAEVITWLIDNRDINGVGVDRVSLDGGQSYGGPAHKALLGRGKFAIENVHNLANIPKKGATVHVMPIFVENGSGGPVRLVAFWNTEMPYCGGSAKYMGSFGGIIVMLIVALISHY